MRPVIVVHGGAGRIPKKYVEERGKHLGTAAGEGFSILSGGGSAVEAVVEAVSYMEDCGYFNAGSGSIPTSNGYVELDAAVMDGEGGFGAVGAVPNIKNPVKLALEVLRRTPHRILVGPEAKYFGLRIGFREMYADELGGIKRVLDYISSGEDGADRFLGRLKRAREVFGDTVGAVAVDEDGRLAAAVSTGGILFKMGGRVGDSSILGAGIMVDKLCASVATGIGEYIIDAMLCYNIVRFRRIYSLAASVRKAVNYMTRLRGSGSGGVISVDRWGRIATMFNTENMGVAYIRPGMDRPYITFNENIFI